MIGASAISPALQAYRAATAGGAAPGAPAGPESGGFDAMLGEALGQVVQTARSADAATQASMLGEAGTTDVVMAVTRAELALQTAVALRDRVVSAYQDVMRMGI